MIENIFIHIKGVLLATFVVFAESAPYLLLGFFLAGFIYVYLKPEMIASFLGKGRISSVINAAILGIPLPLCSCGVLPAAISLKKQGANNGAVSAFLISTPQSGVDSIALTWGIMDPIFALFRPIAGFIISFVAGSLENLLNKDFGKAASCGKAENNDCSASDCCSSSKKEEAFIKQTFIEKVKIGLNYAFIDLLKDIAKWFIIGLFLAGLISYLVPPEIISKYLGGNLESMLIMLIVGIPLYICASASTPIAAALILSGASPGAALVFLIAGPATNIASVAVISKFIGMRATILYLSSIAVLSIVLGYILNFLYSFFGIHLDFNISLASNAHLHLGFIKIISSIILLVLFINVLRLKIKNKVR
ncbi:MAG: SO_0444 family Cu/Zn efflux transporter [Pseudomonadota bacterium]